MRISRNDVTVKPVAAIERVSAGDAVEFPVLLLRRSCR